VTNTNSSSDISAHDLVFAMDIGTRSVIGVVGVLDNALLRVIDIEGIEHDERSVIDGQIEDIDKVGKVAKEVRERLEKRLGIELKNVCVAAAGRALRTQTVTFEFSTDPKTPFNQQMVFSLETGAVGEAKRLLSEASGSTGEHDIYSCVGYSVIRYYLDGYPMKTLINHRGRSAKVELIATFLPVEVVESLTEAMQIAGLRIASLTLEPIAAMNVVIPQELRLLNLALVDVGAGTSDIAISDAGSVAAYAMATVAGDEITEAVAKEYLVDFNTAERIKFSLSENTPEISYQNILGFEYTVTPSEVLAAIRPAVDNLAAVISEKILEINGKPPAAVFLVGGGSRTPGLADYVAGRIGIDRSKVAVGGGNHIKRNVTSNLPVDGPEMATPLGIAVTAALNLGEDGFYVFVNGQKTRLFKRELVTVMDALLTSGFRQDQIIGRSGSSLTFTLNRQKKTIRGEMSEPAEILLNDRPAAISTLISFGDRITFTPAKTGKDAAYTVRDAIKDLGESYVLFGGRKIPIRLSARLNGKPARKKDLISANDELLIFADSSIAEICSSLGMDPSECRFIINGAEKDGKTKVRHGDIVDFPPIGHEEPRQVELPLSDDLKKSADDQKHVLPPASEASNEHTSSIHFTDDRQSSSSESVPQRNTDRILLNGEPFELPHRNDGSPNLFIDLFSYLDIDTSNPQGRLILRINGHEASYLEELSEGDDIQIYWENAAVR